MSDIFEMLTWAKWVLWAGTGAYATRIITNTIWHLWQCEKIRAEIKELTHEQLHIEDFPAALFNLRKWLELNKKFENIQRSIERVIISTLIEKTVKLNQSAPRPKARKLHRPRGWTLHRIAVFVYSRATFERVFAPTLRDLQDEHLEALSKGLRRKACWVVLRGYMSFWSAAIVLVPVSLAKKLHAFWKVIS